MLGLVLLFSQKEREKNGWFFVYKVEERGKADFQWLIMGFFFWQGEGEKGEANREVCWWLQQVNKRGGR